MSRSASEHGERRWSVYGVVITTPFRFTNHLLETAAPADLWMRPVCRPPLEPGWDEAAPCYRSRAMIDESQHFLDVFRTPLATVFRFSEVADFYVFGEGIAYQCHDPDYAYMIELHFLGFVLAYWLEQRGWPALHASSVVIDGHAIAFLSSHGGGKTSLAATLVRLGFPLASDDIVTLTSSPAEILARPGYPQMRMWPAQAVHFVGHDRWQRVNPGLEKLRIPVGAEGLGTFDESLRPLAVLYVPRRGNASEVRITDMPPSEAIFELVRQSFLVRIVEGAGMAADRLLTLAEIVRRVAVRTVDYPLGLDLLPHVAEIIAADARVLIANRPEAHTTRA